MLEVSKERMFCVLLFKVFIANAFFLKNTSEMITRSKLDQLAHYASRQVNTLRLTRLFCTHNMLVLGSQLSTK